MHEIKLTNIRPPDVHPVPIPENNCRLGKVEGGQDRGLPVSGKLPEARCRFAPPGMRGNMAPTSVASAVLSTTRGPTVAPSGGSNDRGPYSGGQGAGQADTSGVLDFGQAAVGVEVTRTVTLQNLGKSQAVFFMETAALAQASTRYKISNVGTSRGLQFSGGTKK